MWVEDLSEPERRGYLLGLERAATLAETLDTQDKSTGPAWHDAPDGWILAYPDGRRDAAAAIRAEIERVGNE